MTKSADRFTTITAAAFTGEPRRHHDVVVDANGTVRVWDSVGQLYTATHALSAAGQELARRLSA